jgi:hypothetical protein
MEDHGGKDPGCEAVNSADTPAASIAGWQGEVLAALLPVLYERLPSGARFGVIGSVATGTTDALSDLDLVAVADDLPDAAGDLSLLTTVGSVWSIDRQKGVGDRTIRVVYTDGRRIDLLVRTSGSDLQEPVLWLAKPPAQEGRAVPIFSSEQQDLARADVLAVRHVAALAAAKLGRRDLLIGAHLCLEVARLALVVGMRLRDQEQERSHHRHGTPRDRDAVRVSGALSNLPAAARPQDWIDLLLHLTEAFDAAAGELWPGHQRDWQGLDAIVAAARTALADPSE